MIGRRPSRGLTLIELLAVIVILTLVFATATVGVTGGTDAAKLREAAGLWRDLDRRARVMALDVGTVTVRLDAAAGRLDVTCGGAEPARAGALLPDGVACVLTTTTGDGVLVYDGLGQSGDYEIRLVCGERASAWSVSGLTGFVREIDA